MKDNRLLLNKLAKLADILDKDGKTKQANIVDEAMIALAEDKPDIRTRPDPVFDSTHPKVKDNKDHFPLGDIDQARNALARASQYSSAPDWWDGSLEELVNAVHRAVKGKYESIDTTEKSKNPGKG